MQLHSITVAIATLALGASAMPRASPLDARQSYPADCVCSSPEAKQNGGCSVTKPDPTRGKPDLHFKIACGKKCTVSVDGKDVRFAAFSTVPGITECKDDLEGWAYCTFDWYSRTVSVDCKP